MEKPKKKEITSSYNKWVHQEYHELYDDWQTYHNEVIEKLADEGEIAKILWSLKNNKGEFPSDSTIAKALSKWIREEK